MLLRRVVSSRNYTDSAQRYVLYADAADRDVEQCQQVNNSPKTVMGLPGPRLNHSETLVVQILVAHMLNVLFKSHLVDFILNLSRSRSNGKYPS